MRRLLAALLVLLAFGCSILDPGDRNELRRQIAMAPPIEQSILRIMAMNAKALQWLEPKDKNDQVGKIQCRDNASGQWSNWYDRPDEVWIVENMINCLSKFEKNYIECAEEFEHWTSEHAHDVLKALLPAGSGIECKHVWDFRYSPEKLPAKAIDPTAVTTDDIINEMIRLPAPPPGWVFPELVPLLCPLGAGPGWGCPPRPTDPTGGQPTNPTGGDYP